MLVWTAALDITSCHNMYTESRSLDKQGIKQIARNDSDIRKINIDKVSPINCQYNKTIALRFFQLTGST